MIRAILFDILGPILLLVACGAVVRWRFKVDVGTLSKLNLYLFVPAFLFDQVSRSTLSWASMGGVVIVTVLQIVTLGLLVWAIGWVLRVHRKTLAAIAIAVMFYNSGNYGLPLAELAYPGGESGGVAERSGGVREWSSGGVKTPAAQPTTQPLNHSITRPLPKDGAAVQAFVVFCQNLLTFTVGLMIAAWAGGAELTGSVRSLFRMPTPYVIAAALAARGWHQAGHEVPKLVTLTFGYLADGMIPIALVTLGAQLAVKPRWPRWRPVSMVLVLRLLLGPVQMAALLYGLHRLRVRAADLWPWPAEALVLTAAVPTAVNTLLLTLEVGGDADLAADCVFWTTVFSCVTITGWLIVLRTWPLG